WIDFLIVQRGEAHAAASTFGITDEDLVAAPPDAPRYGKVLPCRGNARVDLKDCTSSSNAKDVLEPGAVHPRCRAGVPGPACAARVRLVGIYIPGHDVGLCLVSLELCCGPRTVDRVEHMKQLHRFVAVPETGRRDDHPHGRVRVLAAVFSNARQVALDVPGI